MATATLQPDLDAITRGREFGMLNRFVKLKSGSLSLTTSAPPYVDTNALSATATINTPAEDREFDIIVPMGVQLNNYRANPVVLWDHALGEMSRPIAKCVDPSGDLAVVVTEDEIKATSYFSENIEESMQVFHLIAEQLVKATSVRANPIKTRTHKSASGEVGMILDEWDLVEWSWTAVGCNPEAIAKMLERGTIEGTKICAPLLKSLTAVAPKPTEFFKGITLPKENTVAEETTDEEVTKTDPVDETTDTTKADLPEDDTEPSEEVLAMDDTMMEEEDMSVPMGAKVLRSAYSALKTIKSELEAAAGPLENPEVKQLVEELVAQVDDMQKNIDGCHAKSYSDQDALSKMDDAESEETADATMKSLHSLLNRGKSKYLLAGLRSSIKSFATAKNITPKQRKELSGFFRSLQRLENEARNHKPDVTTEQYNALVAQVDGLMDKLTDLLPA